MALKHYSVQPVAEDGLPGKAVSIPVDAKSAVQAAEIIILGQTLVTRGESRKPRAVVWTLGDDYAPIRVTFYAHG